MISLNFFILKSSVNCLLFFTGESENRLKRVVFHDFVAEFVMSLGCKKSG